MSEVHLYWPLSAKERGEPYEETAFTTDRTQHLDHVFRSISGGTTAQSRESQARSSETNLMPKHLYFILLGSLKFNTRLLQCFL